MTAKLETRYYRGECCTDKDLIIQVKMEETAPGQFSGPPEAYTVTCPLYDHEKHLMVPITAEEYAAEYADEDDDV